jgi:hypothetical protein
MCKGVLSKLRKVGLHCLVYFQLHCVMRKHGGSFQSQNMVNSIYTYHRDESAVTPVGGLDHYIIIK